MRELLGLEDSADHGSLGLEGIRVADVKSTFSRRQIIVGVDWVELRD